jgi:hypothetical protein
MIIKAGGKVRHYDLAKMSDKTLHEHREYTYSCCQEAAKRLEKSVFILDLNGMFDYKVPVQGSTIPIWKLIEDLQIHIDRLEAIVEEIKYRHIP